MPVGSTLRYDQVPIEDFLACLDAYEKDVRTGLLPRPAMLKEVKLDGQWAPADGAYRGPLSLFFLQETDALSERTEAFILAHAPSTAAVALRSVAVRIREGLERKKVQTLFRIDPKYGLACGSASETVDPFAKWDRPGCYVAIYLTADPASPSLALMEYVPAEQQARFQELFHRYNRVPPAKASSFLHSTWLKLKGKPAEIQQPRKITYGLVRSVLSILHSEPLKSVTISLIYKDLEQADVRTIILDGKYASFAPSGNDRFIASLGDLT